MIDSRHAGRRPRPVSGPGVTVPGMSAHVCTWFETAWPDHECACGARAVAEVDELGLVSYAVLDDDLVVAREPLSLSA